MSALWSYPWTFATEGVDEAFERLCRRLAEAAGETSLNYVVMDDNGDRANDVWPAGVRLSDLQNSLDRVTALCYTDEPTEVR